MIWVYTDLRNCIYGVNENDMDGNTGWQNIVSEDISIETNLFDEKGAAIYKLIDGEVIERSEDERKGDWPDDPEPPMSDADELLSIILGEAIEYE